MTDENKEVQLQIDLSQFKKKKSSTGNKKEARIAFKRFKVGLPITDHQRYLIEIYYPFLSDDYETYQTKKQKNAKDAFI